MKGYIYKCTFSDGRVYIGQTRKNPEKRLKEHCSPSTGSVNTAFWHAYQKYGVPRLEVLEEIECDTIDELVSEMNYRESCYIHFFKSNNKEYGYNLAPFAIVGTGSRAILDRKYDEYVNELKSKDLRLQMINRVVDKIWRTKEPLTAEEIHLAKEEYRFEDPFQNVIDRFDFNDYSNNREEDIEFMVDDALIFVRFMIEEEIKSDGLDYIIRNKSQILKEERSKNAILQIDKNGNIIKEFYSTNEICQEFNVARADNIGNVLRGKQKTAYGYYWKYKRDVE